MKMSWQHGLGLAVALMLAGTASAQGPKFGPKQPGGNRGASEVERIRDEVKALEAQVERLQRQVNEASKKVGPGKGFEGKGKGPAQAKGPGPEKSKFGPPGFEAKRDMMEMMKKKFEGKGFGPQSNERPQAKGGRPEPKGPPPMAGRGGFGGPQAKGGWGPPSRGDFKGGPPWAQGRSTAPAAPSRGSDLEGRVNRLERAMEELRREVRASNASRSRR